MNKTTLTILVLLIAIICKAQTSDTKYFNNEWLQKEVPSHKAKFTQTVTKNADSSVTTEIKDLKKDEIISSQTFRQEEPFGIWKYRRSNRTDELDYSFDLKYTGNTCKESISGISTVDYFQDNDSLQYMAPKISNGGQSIFQFIAKHTIYPPGARENGIQGTVYLTFKITKEGTVENIIVLRGVNILLDKEAVRVLRQLKLSNPPTLNSQAKEVCPMMPIKFKLM